MVASWSSGESGIDAADVSGDEANSSWNRVAASLCAKRNSNAPNLPLRWFTGRYFSQNTYGCMSRSQMHFLDLRRSQDEDTFGGTKDAGVSYLVASWQATGERERDACYILNAVQTGHARSLPSQTAA